MRHVPDNCFNPKPSLRTKRYTLPSWSASKSSIAGASYLTSMVRRGRQTLSPQTIEKTGKSKRQKKKINVLNTGSTLSFQVLTIKRKFWDVWPYLLPVLRRKLKHKHAPCKSNQCPTGHGTMASISAIIYAERACKMRTWMCIDLLR